MLHRSDDRQLLLTEGQHEIFKVLRWHFFFFFPPHSHLNEKLPVKDSCCSDRLAGG